MPVAETQATTGSTQALDGVWRTRLSSPRNAAPSLCPVLAAMSAKRRLRRKRSAPSCPSGRPFSSATSAIGSTLNVIRLYVQGLDYEVLDMRVNGRGTSGDKALLEQVNGRRHSLGLGLALSLGPLEIHHVTMRPSITTTSVREVIRVSGPACP